MKNTLENEMFDAAISWCCSNGINVLEPEQLASLVNSLYITVCDAALDTAQQAQPERAPLSDAEIKELLPYSWPWGIEFARAIEAAHGIKQGGQHG